MDRSTLERFADRVLVDPATGCWTWIGKRTTQGYGSLYVRRAQVPAHRLSYQHFVGEIPAGLFLDHLCRNPPCVNPGHLMACTPRQNTMAPGSLAPAKRNAEKTECIHGHPFDEANTHVRPNGDRECRTCRYAAKQRYRRRRRNATT